MQETLRIAIADALTKLGADEVSYAVEHPTEIAHGDYATNAAMVAGQQLGKNPRELAEELVEAMALPDGVDRAEIAGPGFINFYLSRNFYTDAITSAIKEGEKWGRNNVLSGKRVMVEYTDPNPFKELHIGHLVPNALGESLARLSEAGGAEVKRVTFQGDVGMHVAKALYGLVQNGVTAESDITAADLGKGYATGATAFESSEEVQQEIKVLNKKIYERSDENINAIYDKGKAVSIAYFEDAYKTLGSDFDHYFFESETGPVGAELVREHIGDVFAESDGAIVFRGEEYGLHTRVFINSEGLPTYEAKDIGLVECKRRWWEFDTAITVTGTEQKSYFEVVTKAGERINPELTGKVELVPNGMLRLSEGKMSSRTGNVVPALTLIGDVKAAALERMKESGIENPEEVAEAVAVGAIKYTILKIAAGKDIVFDLKKSISFEGDSGPYLQYTSARINSVLQKAAGVGVTPKTDHAPETPYAVEQYIYQFPEVVEYATKEREPHHLVTYLTELAGAFNTFYAEEKIADANDEYAPYKAAVAEAVRGTLKNGLGLLGINAPERM